MKKININEVSKEIIASPKGDFALTRQHISIALGGLKDKGPWAGGHPFDIELSTLAPDKKNYPLHAHAAQTEFYIILRGSGAIIDHDGRTHPIEAGDHFIAHPGKAHQIINNSESDLTYYVIADQHPADITTYPKTGKRMLKPENKCVFLQAADYYDGEE
jgi:uncharacterized cupin superfamily protein